MPVETDVERLRAAGLRVTQPGGPARYGLAGDDHDHLVRREHRR
ncbi:hypothetical protein ACGF5C_19330 [Micromonospora sp. NPDC047620]